MQLRLTKIEAIIPTLATREDLACLESKLFGVFQQFSTTVHQNLNDMRQDISGLRTEMTEVHKEIADVHKEMSEVHKEIADVHKEMSEVHKEIADVHKGMSVLHDQITSMSDAINGFSIRSTGSAKPKNKGRVHQAIKASPFTPLTKVGCASEEDETPARMLLNRIRAWAFFSS